MTEIAARHNDVEKARGIIEDLNNHLKGVDGFDKFENGAVSFINHLHHIKHHDYNPKIAQDVLCRMTEIVEGVCASAGYTIDTIRTEQVPLLNIKEDLERELDFSCVVLSMPT